MAYAQASADSVVSQASEHVAVERALAEFRAGRPVLVAAEIPSIAMPVDGLDVPRLRSFRQQCGATPPRLLVTARRAHILGIEAAGPVAVPLRQREDVDTIVSFAADPPVGQRFDGIPAGPAAIAAIELAKLAQLLPALLIAEPGQFPNPGLLVEI